MLFPNSVLPVAAGLVLPAVMATRLNLGARQTSPAERLPAAQLPPAPAPTEPPKRRWGSMPLVERAGSSVGTDTCGYIEGDPPYPLTCGTSWTCTNLGDYRGCCQEDSCTSSESFYAACYDATASVCSSASIGENTLCCTFESAYPYCLTYLWSTSATPGKVFSQFNCDQSIFTGVYFLGAEAPTTTTTSTRSSRSSSDAGSSSVEQPSATSVIVPAPTDSNDDSNSGSSGAPVGPIVGGVVGGVAAIAIVGFLIWFLMRRRRNNANVGAGANNNNNNVQSPLMSQPPPPGYPPQQQGGVARGQAPPGFDPRYSYMSAMAPSSPGNTSGGFPSPGPGQSPVPYQAVSMYGGQPSPQGQQEFYKPPGSDVGSGVCMGYPPPPPPPQQQQQGNVVGQDQYKYGGQPGAVGPRGSVAEAPVVNPVGVGNNRAELE